MSSMHVNERNAPAALEDFVQRLTKATMRTIEQCEGCPQHGLSYHVEHTARAAIMGALYFIPDQFPGIDGSDMFSEWAEELAAKTSARVKQS